MITKGYLTAKLKEICTWKGQNYPTGVVDMIYPRFEHQEQADLDQAIEILQADEEKFTPARLKRTMDRIRYERDTRHWETTKLNEKHDLQQIAERGGECTRDACRGCPRLEGGCQIRGREWLKGIFWIMAASKGEGKSRVEEINGHMRDKFMGGVNR